MLGVSHINLMRPNYNKVTKLIDVEYKVFSQNGEDGIIDYITYQLNIDKPKFLEIGVGDYSESNTKFLYDRVSTKGAIIDCLDDFKDKVLKKTKVWKGTLEIINQKINSKNVLETLNKKNILENLDIFSIDIDGIDYWILRELPKNFSKIAIIEYNSIFGKEKSISVPNIDDFNRTDYHFSDLCFGMSLQAAIQIMKEKNFYFLGVNLMRNNAFFVSNIFPKDKFFKNLILADSKTIDEANFRESRNREGKLNYLDGVDKIKEIFECEVIDLSESLEAKKKIKDLFD